jgi:hypothetical protein
MRASPAVSATATLEMMVGSAGGILSFWAHQERVKNRCRNPARRPEYLSTLALRWSVTRFTPRDGWRSSSGAHQRETARQFLTGENRLENRSVAGKARTTPG